MTKRGKTWAVPLLSIVITCAAAHAAPQVSLAVNRRADDSLQFIIAPSSSAAGCTLRLYGAARRKLLAQDANAGALLTETDGGDAAVELNAAGLPPLRGRGKRSRTRMYFAAEALCAGGTERSVSEIRRLRWRSARRGAGGRAWLAALRDALQAAASTGVTGAFNAFPGLVFSAPVDLQNANDGSDRLFVVEQAGTIRVFPNSSGASTSKVFLDIRSKVVAGGEQGLLGLAFHPDYADNGLFFVNYTAAPDGATVIARFSRSAADADSADAASELEILRVAQPFANHNGGGLRFGPDGFLYIALGDGGSAGDPMGNGQSLTTLLGKILRIDADGSSPGRSYGIPGDNPFAGNSSGFREEIFAYGFRNPWRFSFDPLTGRLWAGDVGQDAREEIDIVTAGGNYGWNIMEGAACFDPPRGCDRSGLTLPISDYDRSQGFSVTGGFVYRGSSLPALTGRYVYADFGSGKLWSLPADAGPGAFPEELLDTELHVSSFGLDERGELYLLDHGSGAVFALR